MRLRCNSCGGIFPDTRATGSVTYHHACPDEIVDQPEQINDKNEVTKAATHKRVENPRNENLKPHPDKPGEYVMVSEGNGITEAE